MLVFRISVVLLLVIFSSTSFGDMAARLGPEFQVDNPELSAILIKAETLCTPPERFSDDMVVFVRDSTIEKLSRFQGASYFAKASRLPVDAVRTSVKATHHAYRRGYNWYYGIEENQDPGYVGKMALIAMVLETQNQLKLSQSKSACLAACVSRVVLKYVPFYYFHRTYQSLFAPSENLLKSGQASCVDFAHFFETFANELNLPTYSFQTSGGLYKSSFLLSTALGTSINYYATGTLSSNIFSWFNFGNSLLSNIKGHYKTQISLDGKDYIFDPLFDYKSRDYSCEFHER